MPWVNPNPMHCVSDPTGIFDSVTASRGDFATWMEDGDIPMGSTWRIGDYERIWQIVDGDDGALHLRCETGELTPDGLRNFRGYRGASYRTSVVGYKRRLLVAIHHYTTAYQDCPGLVDISRRYDIGIGSVNYHVQMMIHDGLLVHQKNAYGDLHLTAAGSRIARRIMREMGNPMEAARG